MDTKVIQQAMVQQAMVVLLAMVLQWEIILLKDQ